MPESSPEELKVKKKKQCGDMHRSVFKRHVLQTMTQK